ncbi:hypothetical protein L7F22_009611 [Adiantum nelumboides]|nr:hypothetical protein [Adiantum nelumboides]
MTSSVDSHSVPPFYACYLLRSYATSSSARTYIGSTPDPARRKKQHNGLLTQGAHKTKRGRPWETQMLVYGFPSKIAALQFEWAWQKPHMSRHLRTHPQISDIQQPSSSQQQHVAIPLFTDTPLNQIVIGEDGCKPLPCSSVQTSLLVARALLKSEPFAGWGLQIVFFEEYLWAAWKKLQTVYSTIAVQPDAIKVGLNIDTNQTRLSRALPPQDVSPNTMCDFSGVDGGRKSMLKFTEEERKAAKLESHTSGKAKGKVSAEGKPPGLWPEKLPKTLNVRSMGGTWQLLEAAPYPATSSVERGKKKDVDQESTTQQSSKSPQFHLDDEDVAFQSFKRFQSLLDARSLSIEDVLPLSVSLNNRRNADRLQGKCNICRKNVDLQDHTSYSLCPSPFEQLQPKPTTSATNRTQNLSRFGFGNSSTDDPKISKRAEYRHCESIFHIRCLADSFLKQNNQKGRFLLPTHGCCPTCFPTNRPSDLGRHNLSTWNEVIRGTFRRRDYVLREAKMLDIARMKAAKVAIQQAKKVRKTGAKKDSVSAAKKKVSSSQKVKDPIRHGDSDHEEEQVSNSEKENHISTNFTSIPTFSISGNGGLMSMLDQIEDVEECGQISNVAALASKRTVPSNWTPLPARTAPSDRINAQRNASDDNLESDLDSASPTKSANIAHFSTINRRSAAHRLPATPDVIDLT